VVFLRQKNLSNGEDEKLAFSRQGLGGGDHSAAGLGDTIFKIYNFFLDKEQQRWLSLSSHVDSRTKLTHKRRAFLLVEASLAFRGTELPTTFHFMSI